ncbi:MAG: pilus assembly protein [Mesorhizobium sp.]
MKFNFLRDRRGNFAMMTSIALVPLLGGLALAVDYTEVTRQRSETLNALDAAGLATAQYLVTGATDTQLKAYAKDFFEANLSAVDKKDVVLHVQLPTMDGSLPRLKLSADLTYKPYFFSGFSKLLSKSDSKTNVDFTAQSEIQLKNTLEIALALDNSGSMNDTGTGSGKRRIDLLKEASKKLIDTLALQAALIKQIDKPVQFSLVPFAASVNVGPDNASAAWMDTQGLSPVHHENFDWSTMASADSTKKVEKVGGMFVKTGNGWGTEKGQVVTRFSLFNEVKKKSGSVFVPAFSWKGCVETRPYPYNTDDTTPSSGTPSTLFVPLFAPDETDLKDTYARPRPANNNWWADTSTNASSAVRQRYMPKYFKTVNSYSLSDSYDIGPNSSCTTVPITPLTDVTVTAGANKMKDAIDEMQPLGGTNVPEGIAWGWRTLSSGEPFAEGRPEAHKGNDKVLILLTDGANTYYHPESVVAAEYSGTNWDYGGNNLAASNSIYSAYGYLKPYNNGTTYGRLFQGTSNAISKTTFTNANYTKALNEQMAATCSKAKEGKIMVMTIALDLDATKGTAEQKAQIQSQIDGLQDCASTSRVRSGKLFFNTSGKDLDETFRKIGEELLNLRIVG